MKRILYQWLLGYSVLILFAGCATMQSHWEATKSADTIQAYEEFLEQHPKGELADQARARLNQLYEQRDWKDATRRNTVRAYEDFLTRYPRGSFADEARSRLEPMCFQEAKLKNTIEAYDEFLRRYPKGALADEVRSKREEVYKVMLQDWKRVQGINTIYTYEEFLKRYPGSEFSGQARYRVMRQYWERAQTTNTIAGYEEFLRFYPYSEFAYQAREKLESLYQREGFISFVGTISNISYGLDRMLICVFVRLELTEYPGVRFHIGEDKLERHRGLLFGEEDRRIRRGWKVHLICKQRDGLCEIHSLKRIQ